MGYLSLYRKWRPKTFTDLAGQSTVSKTLQNAIINNRIAHAYLFSGPRGTGKTSTAKIFAKALNCHNRDGVNPCNQCYSCEQVNSGRSVDIIEIDAASNRRIDEIRDLREKVKFSPSEGAYKVYIIDEVHMLTKEAFNALLKTLEEPPENVVFILATTEPHKVIPTIISRCQRFDFGLLSLRELKERMKYICAEENVQITDGALNLIARTAEGGMRDALSILDQAIAFGGAEVSGDDVNTILGRVDQRILSDLVSVIARHDSQAGLTRISEILDQGKDINQFVKDLLSHFRDLMLIRECGLKNTLIDLTEELKEELAGQAQKFTTKELLRILEVLSEADQQLKLTSQPRLVLEMTIIKLVAKEADTSITNLISRLAALEELVEKGQFAAAPALQSENRRPPAVQPGIKPSQQVKQDPPPWDVNYESSESAESPYKQENPLRAEKKVASGTGSSADILSDEKKNPVSQIAQDVPPAQTAASTTRESRNPASSEAVKISPEELLKHWEVTMNLLNKAPETRKIRAFLVAGKPGQIQGDTLYIVFPKSSIFHKSNAEKEQHHIEKALKKVTGLNIKVACIFEGEEPTTALAVDTALEMNEPPISMPQQLTKETVQDDALVQKVLKVFGGKIIQVENE